MKIEEMGKVWESFSWRHRIGRRSFLKALAVAAVAVAVVAGAATAGEAAGRLFTFIQMSDPQPGHGGYEHDLKTFEMAVNQVNRMKVRPDFVLICGDLVNGDHGRVGDFTKIFNDYKKIANKFKIKACPVPGNHDVGKYPNAFSLKQYREQIGKDYYSFEHKGYTFVAVNTLLWWSTVGGGQMPKEREKHDAWFEQTLEKAQKGKIIVFGHHPLFLKKPDEQRTKSRFCVLSDKREWILGLFEKYGVAAYLAGHKHANWTNEYKGTQLITVAATCRNHRNQQGKVDPLGYYIWLAGGKELKRAYVPIKGADSVPE